MHMLHSSIELVPIVHLQHLPKYSPQATKRTHNRKVRTMAFMDHTHAKTESLVERTLTGSASFLASAAQRHARYRIYRDTLYELSQLSDREANDLGLHRSQFKNLAWEAALEKTA